MIGVYPIGQGWGLVTSPSPSATGTLGIGMLNSIVTVKYKTGTRNEMGGLSYAWANRIEGLTCSISQMTEREFLLYGKTSSASAFNMYCNYNTDTAAISMLDRMVDANSITYEVTAIKNPSMLNRHLEIVLEIVD